MVNVKTNKSLHQFIVVYWKWNTHCPILSDEQNRCNIFCFRPSCSIEYCFSALRYHTICARLYVRGIWWIKYSFYVFSYVLVPICNKSSHLANIWHICHLTVRLSGQCKRLGWSSFRTNERHGLLDNSYATFYKCNPHNSKLFHYTSFVSGWMKRWFRWLLIAGSWIK